MSGVLCEQSLTYFLFSCIFIWYGIVLYYCWKMHNLWCILNLETL